MEHHNKAIFHSVINKVYKGDFQQPHISFETLLRSSWTREIQVNKYKNLAKYERKEEEKTIFRSSFYNTF